MFSVAPVPRKKARQFDSGGGNRNDDAKKNAAPDGPRNGAESELIEKQSQNSTNTKKVVKKAKTNRFCSLPFVKLTGPKPGTWDYWCVEEPNCLHQANMLGELYANLTIKLIHETGSNRLLGYILADMVAKGSFGGIEIGFATRIADKVTP